MARPAYSTLFAHLSPAPGGTNIFTVPAQFVYVVRDVDWYQDQVAGAAVVRLSETVANAFWFAGSMPVTRYAGLAWRGRQVFEVGETLQAWSDLPNVWVRISGYVLNA